MKFFLLALTLLMPLLAQDSAVLNGNDPVILATTDQEKAGSAKITVKRGDFTYRFVDAKNKAEFDKNPEKYEIQMGGACARMGASSGVSGNPDLYAVHDKKIYVFGTDNCREIFLKDPKSFTEKK